MIILILSTWLIGWIVWMVLSRLDAQKTPATPALPAARPEQRRARVSRRPGPVAGCPR